MKLVDQIGVLFNKKNRRILVLSVGVQTSKKSVLKKQHNYIEQLEKELSLPVIHYNEEECWDRFGYVPASKTSLSLELADAKKRLKRIEEEFKVLDYHAYRRSIKNCRVSGLSQRFDKLLLELRDKFDVNRVIAIGAERYANWRDRFDNNAYFNA